MQHDHEVDGEMKMTNASCLFAFVPRERNFSASKRGLFARHKQPSASEEKQLRLQRCVCLSPMF